MRFTDFRNVGVGNVVELLLAYARNTMKTNT